MDIIEDKAGWSEKFKATWLAHYQATGETDFKRQYAYVKNTTAPSGPGLDPAQSRLLFVTSSGAYLKDTQAPFDAANPLGDYSIRTFDMSTSLDRIGFAHEHYDHRYVDDDPQAVLPLRHLEDLHKEGRVGAWVPTVVSFSGYMPDAARVVDEVVPAVMDILRREEAHGALLVPV